MGVAQSKDTSRVLQSVLKEVGDVVRTCDPSLYGEWLQAVSASNTSSELGERLLELAGYANVAAANTRWTYIKSRWVEECRKATTYNHVAACLVTFVDNCMPVDKRLSQWGEALMATNLAKLKFGIEEPEDKDQVLFRFQQGAGGKKMRKAKSSKNKKNNKERKKERTNERTKEREKALEGRER